MTPEVHRNPLTNRDAPGVMLPEVCRVLSNDAETHDTFTLRLERESGEPFEFLPGQFNMLYGFGMGESAISISGDPEKNGTLIHTIRRVGTVTRALSELNPGDTIGIRGPFGSAWPVDRMFGRDLVFLAGGIGLAPLRPAIYYALNHRERYGKIVILIGARSPKDVIFAREIEQWSEKDGVEIRISVDRATPDWKQHVGVVTHLIAKGGFDPARSSAMMCGPEIMMRYAILELNRRGMDDSGIFLTMERNMKCAVGFCGHCQLGPAFICRDGPVFRYDHFKTWFNQREL